MPKPSAGLALIRRYFQAYLKNANKVTLFIKGYVDFKTIVPTTARDQVLASAEACIKHLNGAKKIDVFGPTHVNPNVLLKETLRALRELIKANKIKAATAKRLNIPIVAYSPLGRGFLTGHVKSIDDIPERDIRRRFDHFQPENFNKNLKLVDKLKAFATKAGVTPAQLALSWIHALSNSKVAGPIIPIPGATSPERVQENSKDVVLSPEDKAKLNGILASFKIQGSRYNAALKSMLWR